MSIIIHFFFLLIKKREIGVTKNNGFVTGHCFITSNVYAYHCRRQKKTDINNFIIIGRDLKKKFSLQGEENK